MKNIECDSGSQINYNDFINLYPIYHFDLTAIEPSIFENSSTPEILIDYSLEGLPEYYFIYTLVVNERTAEIKALDQKIFVLT